MISDTYAIKLFSKYLARKRIKDLLILCLFGIQIVEGRFLDCLANV